MFKKNKIAVATLALLGAAAAQNVSAVAIDESGTNAQVLIFPYYNVNNNFQTAINIRNTKNVYKAVKVRFRESKFSNDVLDFNLYLSPYDHWSATVSNQNGVATIQSQDKSCTHPSNISDGAAVAFIGNVYKNTSDADAKEGYVEVIEMGEIPYTVKPDGTATTKSGTVSAPGSDTIAFGLKHVVTAGVSKPSDCTVIPNAWGETGNTPGFTQGGAYAGHASVEGDVTGGADTNGIGLVAAAPNYTTNLNGDRVIDPATAASLFYGGNARPGILTPPTGGLAGFSYLLGLTDGAAFVGDPIALRNYTSRAQHYKSSSQAYYLLPSLASGDVVSSTVNSNYGSTSKDNTWTTVRKDWAPSDPGAEFTDAVKTSLSLSAKQLNSAHGSGVNPFPIADVLAATGLTNDFIVDSATNANTDWVITLPMRKHGIWNGYTYDGLPKATDHAIDKFTGSSGVITATPAIYDREEQVLSASQAAQFSPPVNPVRGLDKEVNVLTFGPASTASKSLLGSINPIPFNTSSFKSGWASIAFSSSAADFSGSSYNLVTSYTGWLQSVTGVNTLTQSNGVTIPTQSVGVPAIGFASLRGAFSANLTADNVGETARHNLIRNR